MAAVVELRQSISNTITKSEIVQINVAVATVCLTIHFTADDKLFPINLSQKANQNT